MNVVGVGMVDPTEAEDGGTSGKDGSPGSASVTGVTGSALQAIAKHPAFGGAASFGGMASGFANAWGDKADGEQ